MGRLKYLPSQLSALAPLVARQADSEGHVAQDTGRSWYHLSRWKHPTKGLRIRTFIRDGFRCQWPGCGRVEPAPRLRADHKLPHRGDPVRFWDPNNVWNLCQPHHDGAKQAEERQAGVLRKHHG